MAIERVRIF